MITYEISESIDADPADVFGYLSKPDLYPHWMGVESVEVVTPDIVGSGLRWRATTPEGPILMENSEYEENRSWATGESRGRSSGPAAFSLSQRRAELK